MSWREFLWSWKGRLNRRQALLGIYGVGIPATIVSMILVAVLGTPAPNGGYLLSPPATFFALTMPHLAVFPFVVSLLVRRVHDHGKSGSVWLLWLVSFVVVGLLAELPAIRDTAFEVFLVLPVVMGFFWLLLSPGERRTNAYGEMPAEGWWP